MIKKSLTSRLLSVDVFRGLIICWMIIVNSPGNQTSYAFLKHAEWHGCSLADLVFPCFLFTVGISLVLSLRKQQIANIPRSVLFIKIFKRTTLLFSLGLLLNAFPYHFDLRTLRFAGVLQHIALCYCLAALIFLTTRVRTQVMIMLSILFGYWLILTQIPVPGFGANNLSPEGNLAAYIDRLIFYKEQLYGKVFDPEGLLTTLPAIATTLLGNLTGVWLLNDMSPRKKCLGMLIAGGFFLCAGWFWGLWFPINKALWTSSYVLWTGGIALSGMALCYWFIEIKSWQRIFKIFEIFGANAIAAFVLHIFFMKIQGMIRFPQADGTTRNLRLLISDHLFGWTSMQSASLMYALCYMLLWLTVLWILYRQKIFIKI